MEPIEAIFFDLDGTLCDSLAVAHGATCALLVEQGRKPVTFDEYHTHCRPPYAEFYKERGVSLTDAEIWKRFLELADFSEAPFFPDAITVLKECMSRGILLGLVSAQRSLLLQHCLERHGVSDLFTAGIVGDAEHKGPVIAELCRLRSISPSRSVYIGDSVSDIHAAREAGVRSVGITRGLESRERLLEAGAVHIIEHLTELLPLFWNGGGNPNGSSE